jgi:Kef-type K+ transport system membrane component KefB
MLGLLSLDLPLASPSGVFLVLFVVVLVMPRLAENLRLPGLVGLTVGGMLIGPFGFNVLEREGLVALLGGAGLLFLMFEAGLELDRDVLRQERRQTAVFGVLTFAAPFALGTAVHLWLGYSWLAALLLASCWSSHTLLAYPVFQRGRVTDNRAVTVGLGGTVITDTAALLFLVAVVRLEEGDLNLSYLVTTGPALISAAVAILWALPRIGAWFFASIGQERSARFLFVMVALFAASSAAELAGVEPIIGAFLAGLALNRIVVHGSTLSTQVAFFGSNLLTPMFMISVGMLIDPALLISDGTTLIRAAGFTAAVVGGKALAAYVTGRLFRWRRAEIVALFSLSVAQAAATLAAVFVGFDIGILDESTVNAAIIVILITCVLASLTGGLVVSRLPPPPAKIERLGRRVLLPLSDRTPLGSQLRIAAAIAARDAGTVLPLTVLGYDTAPADLRQRRAVLVDTVERMVLASGAEAQSEVRLDSSRAAGVLHAAIEQDATCVVIGWKGWSTLRESFFGEAIDSVLARTSVPVLVVRPSTVEQAPTQVVVAYEDSDQRLDHRRAVEIAAVVGERLARALKVPLVVCKASADSPVDLDAIADRVVVAPDGRLASLLQTTTTHGDVIVKPLPSTRAGLGNRFVRQTQGLDDRVIVATSPASTDITPH